MTKSWTLGRTKQGVLLILFLIAACTPLIGPYSPTAYQNATSLKPQALALMTKARESFSAHQTEIETLNIELQQAHEFVKGVPSNSISAGQWQILIDSDGDLLGKFFRRWQERTSLSETYILEFKGIVADAFDEIICLEANKKDASQCQPREGE